MHKAFVRLDDIVDRSRMGTCHVISSRFALSIGLKFLTLCLILRLIPMFASTRLTWIINSIRALACRPEGFAALGDDHSAYTDEGIFVSSAFAAAIALAFASTSAITSHARRTRARSFQQVEIGFTHSRTMGSPALFLGEFAGLTTMKRLLMIPTRSSTICFRRRLVRGSRCGITAFSRFLRLVLGARLCFVLRSGSA